MVFWKTTTARIDENYITEVFEEIQGRGTRNISQLLSEAENTVLDAIWNVDDFFLKSQVVVHFRNDPGTSRDTSRKNYEIDDDSFQNHLLPEVDGT